MTAPVIGSLFSGYGGLDLGVRSVLGGRVAWHADIDPGACAILEHRFPGVPNLGDITAVDWSAVEPVDVLTGGFPCQDVSLAGLRKGLRPDTRSGLWEHFAHAVNQLRPGLVVIENVRGLLSAAANSYLEPCDWCVGDDGGVPLRALGAVLGDLADIGYDTSWHSLTAADVGAPHGRFRVFVLAWPAADAVRLRGQRRGGHGDLAGPPGARQAHGDQRERHGHAAHDRGAASPDPIGGGRHGRALVPVGGPVDGAPAAGGGAGAGRWGPYEPAVSRWEQLTRPAPEPTTAGRSGPRLSPSFVEWMMGLPSGWVTAVPGLTRNQQLKALGNGVVPQQAAAALRILLDDTRTEETAA